MARSQPDLFKAIVEAPSPIINCYRTVVVDLFWQIQQLSCGVHALLASDLDLALVVVERALFEAGIAVGYLRNHSDRHREGAVFLAYTHLKEMEDFADEANLVAERTEILARMPCEVVEVARSRISSRPFTWTGVSLRKAAQIAQMTGYEKLYGPLSGVGHISRTGRYFRVIHEGDDRFRVETGLSIGPEGSEAAANFARRLLHESFKLMWTALGGRPVSFTTTDPVQWHKAHGGFSPSNT